mgnify:CR=1 FL=1
MKLDKTKEVLEVLQGVDIPECAVFAEKDTNQLRAVSNDRSTIVFTDVEKFIETQVGILSVKGLLTRLNLFDTEKAGVNEETKESEQGDYISDLTIKEGRRRSKVKTTHPQRLAAPTKYPDAKKAFTAFITKEYVDYIGKMKSSISSVPSQEDLTLSLSVDSNTPDETINLSIGGGYDNFHDEVEGEILGDFSEFSATWKIDSLMRVLKRAASSLDDEDYITLTVNDLGIMEVDVNGVVVSISSQNNHSK